ncbi:hypothetical protein Tco_0374431 [Tanacetum coccineum]
MADSQSLEEEVKGINSKGRGTGPRKGSAVPFPLDPHHPPLNFISKDKNMLKTRRGKPNEKFEFQGIPHPSPDTMGNDYGETIEKSLKNSGEWMNNEISFPSIPGC